MKTFKVIKRIINNRVRRKKPRSIKSGGVSEPSQPEENFDKEVKALKNRITREKDEDLKNELLVELKECEEKYQLGLVNLGHAYAKKIKSRLDNGA